MAWKNPFQVWLSESESLQNAQLVANRMLKNGWSKNAICAVLGNMRHESSVNPNMYEYGFAWGADRGFGLVQWTPRSKYWNWALSNGYPESELRNGEAQLDFMDYEMKNGIQWIATPNYPMSYKEFSVSKQSVDYLTQAFTWNYERPNAVAGMNSTPDRIRFAKMCYNKLDFSGASTPSEPVDDTQLAILPIDIINITQGELGPYSHYAGSLNEYGIDFTVPGQVQYPLYAPCDSIVIDTMHNYAQVCWKSVKPVMCADGQKRHIWYRIVHDENSSRWSVGDKISKGELIGHTGNGGNSNGDHLHLDVFLYKEGVPWYSQLGKYDEMLHNYDVFAINNNKKIINGFGYNWRKSEWKDGEGGTTSNNSGDTTPTKDPTIPTETKPVENAIDGIITKFVDELTDGIEEMLTQDVYKLGQSDFYTNKFIKLSKQLDNTYKVKPNLDFIDSFTRELEQAVKKII